MSLREQFEARFPVPAGVKWSEEHQNYGWIKKIAFQRVITYRALWLGWQESRQYVAVQLPNRYEIDGFDGIVDREDGPLLYAEDVIKQIEAQGLKVAP